MTDNEEILKLITSYETIAGEFTLDELDHTDQYLGLEHLPCEGVSRWMQEEGKLPRFRQASDGIMFYGLVTVSPLQFLVKHKIVVQFL